jgi:hypothetical protein
MKNIKFVAKSTAHHLSGILVIRSKGIEFIFESDLPEFQDVKIPFKEIKDTNNFIASRIKMIDVNAHFSEVHIENKDIDIIPILRKNAIGSMDVIVIGDLINQVIIPSQPVNIIGLNGKEHSIKAQELGKVVNVPELFKYTNEAVLNKILAFNVMPIDYDRTWNTKILKNLSTNKNKIEQSDPKDLYLYINQYNELFFKKPKNFLFVFPKNILSE